MTSAKKTKLLVGICIPVGAITVAAGTTAIVLAVKSKQPVAPFVKKDYTVTFDAGEGSFAKEQKKTTDVYAGEHFDEIDKPVVEHTNKVFTGWADENGQRLMGRQPINKDMKLTALYEPITGEYARIIFSAGDTGAVIQGNASIAVNKGFFFFMINRPSVKHETKYFLNWKYLTGSKAGKAVREQDVITESVTLVPELTQTVVMNWNGNGATQTRGTSVTKLQAGTQFYTINQPCFENGTKMFSGWYKDQACNTPWQPLETVNANSTAYAKWETAPSQYYCSVSYIKKPGTDIQPIFAPASSQVVLKTSEWSTIFKPNVTTVPADYKVDHWEYSLDGTTGWTKILDATKLNFDSVYVAPILVPKAENVYVYGASSVLTETETKLYAYVLGCATQNVSWKVYDDATCMQESTIAEMKSDGTLKVNFVGVENKKVYVKATSTIDTSASSEPYEVDIIMPYMNSDLVWYNNGTNWYSIDQIQLSNKSSTKYIATKLVDNSTIEVNKADSFTNKLFIGRRITTVLEDFLIGFTGFNGEIDFSVKYDSQDPTKVLNSKNNVTYIQGSFMEGCKSFNQYLNLESVKSIGTEFLFGCSAFNNGSQALDLSKNKNLHSIGKNFMSECYHFNQEIKLPTDGILTEIGEYFLYSCLRFNSPINLPSTLQSVGPFFMLDCVSFTNTITVDCRKDVFDKSCDNQICSETEKWDDPETEAKEETEAAIYNPGFKVSGTYADEFIERFPTTTGSSVVFVWRTVSKAS